MQREWPMEARRLTDCRGSSADWMSRRGNWLCFDYYSDMSFKEIAEMRGEPIGTVISKVHRGLKEITRTYGITIIRNMKMDRQHNKENKEELRLLLAQFYNEAEAKQAADDIEAGERIFSSFPAPEPAETVKWRIKAAVVKAAREKRQDALDYAGESIGYWRRRR